MRQGLLCLAACLERSFNSRTEGSLGLNPDKGGMDAEMEEAGAGLRGW